MSADQEWDELELSGSGGTRGGVKRLAWRLTRYALGFKSQLLLALLMLTVSVGTDLAGPMVAKRIIDVHISDIELSWYEAERPDSFTVSYEGSLYKRADHFAPDEARGGEVRVLQVEKSYYFVQGAVQTTGERRIGDSGQLIIGNEAAEYPAVKLSSGELYGFFRPELGGLIRLCWVYFGLLAASALFAYGQRYFLQSTANRVIRQMRGDVFRQVNRLPVRYFDNLPAGKVVSRITNDTEAIRELYVNVLSNFFTGVIYMTGVFIALFLLDVKLAMICLLVVPILMAWIALYSRYAKSFNRKIRSTLSELNGMINESIQGMPIIQAFRRERGMESEFSAMNQRLYGYQMKLLKLNSLTGHTLAEVVRNLAFVAMIWYFGGVSVGGVAGVATLGVLYAFVDYLNRLFNPIVDIVNQLPQLETSLVSAERVFRLLDEAGEDVSDERIPRYAGNVKFEHVSFSYNGRDDVLKDVSFEAAQGQTVALVGHTGSGKSSILNLLFRFYDLEAGRGRITIDGMDAGKLAKQSLRAHMGIVLQDPFLFTGTIASNVSLDHPEISRERIERALRDVGAEQLLLQLPRGIDEPVIEKGATLSAGQRQLISFARALAYDPAILILDEATSNIDTETEQIIQNALDVVKRGRTTFVIAHRLSTIKSADQILVLDHGAIVERGDHESLLRQGGKYYQMYQLQQGEAG